MKILKLMFVAILIAIMSNCLTAQNSWTQKANFGGSARQWANGFSIGDKGYIIGGDDGYLSDELWEYNPTTNTWTQKADFPGGPRRLGVAFSIGNKGYYGTGEYDKINSLNEDDFWEYDASTDSWTQLSDFPGGARRIAVGFSIGDKGYVGTGFSNQSLDDFWEYDPSTDSWTQLSDFPGGARYYAVGFSINGKGYLGVGYNGGKLNDFWEYDPASDNWTQKADYAGSGNIEPVGFSINSRGYIGTGSTNNKQFWEYNPCDNSWLQVADLGGTGRRGAVGFSIGNHGYIGTGYSGNYLRDFWEYTSGTISCDSHLLFEDGFESYNVDEFPSNWTLYNNGEGTEYQKVINSDYHSGEKSLQLKESSSYSHEALAYKQLNINPDFIICEGWFKAPGDDYTAGYIGLSNFESPSYDYATILFTNEGKLYYKRGSFSIEIGEYPTDVWVKLKMNVDFINKEVSIWINDELSLVNYNDSDIPDVTQLYFWLQCGGNQSNTVYFDDIKLRYCQQCDLVAYYPFDGSANDESGNGNNGTVYGATLVEDRFGNENSAYSFDGSNDYIEVPDALQLQLQNSFTISMWVYVNGWWGNEWAPLIAKGDKISYPVYLMNSHRTDGWILEINTNNNVSTPYMTPLSTGEWTFVAWTWDGTNSFLYINDNKYELYDYNGSQDANSGSLVFGNALNPNIDVWYNGVLDDVRIYNCALNDGQIAELYGDETPPIAQCKNTSVTLSNGYASITPEDVDNGSSDESGIKSLSVEPNTFDCSNIGDNSVTLTVTDNFDNTSTCEAIVTVEGELPEPSITVDPSKTMDPGGEENTIYIGYGEQVLTMTASEGTTYQWSSLPTGTSSDEQSINITPSETTTYTVIVSNEYGCEATASVIIYVVDVRCGNDNNNKVKICHRGHTICVADDAVNAHIDHGDYIGQCSQPKQSPASTELSNEYYLEQNSPNPFDKLTIIKYGLPEDGFVTIKIFDILGNEVSTLVKEFKSRGVYTITFENVNLSKGLYYYKMQSHGVLLSKVMMVE